MICSFQISFCGFWAFLVFTFFRHFPNTLVNFLNRLNISAFLNYKKYDKKTRIRFANNLFFSILASCHVFTEENQKTPVNLEKIK